MSPKEKKDVLGLVSLGLFLVFIGVIFSITPNWYSAARDFVKDFELVKVNQNISLPAPKSNHPVVYTAIEQFCLVWGLFQIGILVSKFFLRDTVHKKAETFSGIIFWFGAAYLTSLLVAESISWFAFWAGIVTLVGISIIARSLVVLLYEFTR